MKLDNKERQHGLELGKLLAERAGLDPSKVSDEWDATSTGTTVYVTLMIPMPVPVAEFEALNKRAAEIVG